MLGWKTVESLKSEILEFFLRRNCPNFEGETVQVLRVNFQNLDRKSIKVLTRKLPNS
jgi:hypothetical protein